MVPGQLDLLHRKWELGPDYGGAEAPLLLRGLRGVDLGLFPLPVEGKGMDESYELLTDLGL